MILRARIVWPVSRPAIEDGAVVISGNRIEALGSWPEIKAHSAQRPVDLGAAILLPGLINAHCHLDYTGMTGLPAPRQFPDWLKALFALKAAAGYTDYAHAWLTGAAMLARTGCTTVADIEAVPELLPEVSVRHALARGVVSGSDGSEERARAGGNPGGGGGEN